MHNVLLGSDPEVFLKRHGAPLMAIGLIGGTKANPRPLGNGYVQEDNVAAEFNIVPQNTLVGWLAAHSDMLQAIEDVVAPIGAEVAVQPIMHFTQEALMAEPKSLIMGCEPDFSIYSGECPRPNGRTTLRTAAGHIHVGSDIAIERREDLVKAMDCLLGVPASKYDTDWEERTELYGGFGKYRPKSYGLEYRALSNFWLTSPSLIEWAYNKTLEAVERIDEFTDVNLRDVINSPASYGVAAL